MEANATIIIKQADITITITDLNILNQLIAASNFRETSIETIIQFALQEGLNILAPKKQ